MKSLQSQSGVLARRRALAPGSGNSGESMLYLANMCLGAPTALVSQLCVCLRVCLEGVMFVAGLLWRPLHLCALCYGSQEALTHSLMEHQKPPPVNTSINNLSLVHFPPLSLPRSLSAG